MLLDFSLPPNFSIGQHAKCQGIKLRVQHGSAKEEKELSLDSACYLKEKEWDVSGCADLCMRM